MGVRHYGKYINIRTRHTYMGVCHYGKYLHSSHLYGRSPPWEGLDSKTRSRSRSTIFATTTPFDDKCQNIQTSFFTFVIFAMVRPVQTIVTDRHTYTEMDKPIAIGKILQFFLKIAGKTSISTTTKLGHHQLITLDIDNFDVGNKSLTLIV